MKRQTAGLRVALVSLAIAGVAPSALAQKVILGAKKPHHYSKLEIIAWHLQKGEELKDEGRLDEASAHWREVLRLAPNNRAAKLALDTVKIPGINLVGISKKEEPLDVDAISGQVRDAIKAWSEASDIAGVADILEDRCADPLGKRLLRAYRLAIMKADGGVLSPDTQLVDEFEQFVDANNLSGVANEVQDGRKASDMGRPYGRDLMKRIQAWERRAQFSGIEMHLVRPYEIDRAALHLDKVHLNIVNSKLVEIDDPDFGDPIPIEARFEDGKWRIGSRPGSTLFYDVRIVLHGTHRMRRVH